MPRYIIAFEDPKNEGQPLFQTWSTTVMGSTSDPMGREAFEAWYRKEYSDCEADLSELMANAEKHGCSDPEVNPEELAYLEQHMDGFDMEQQMDGADMGGMAF